MGEITRGRKRFPELSPHAFEHPLDRSALLALQKMPGLDWVIRKFLTTIGERRLRLLFLASSVRANDAQFARLRGLLEEASAILGMEETPDLFVSQKFALNAAAIGVDRPFIVITSSLVEMMDDEELQCVLGHELGHILSGHSLYTTMLVVLLRMWHFFLGVPGGIYAVIAISLSLLEWRRKAELSADRAGLLVSQDPNISYRVDMKLAGGRRADEMDLDSFMAQAEEYEAGGDLLDGVLKLALIARETHPFPVLRVAELRKWVESGEYERILQGDYPRHSDDETDSWLESVKRTADAYRESFEDSQDPLVSTLRDLSGGAAATGAEVLEFIRRAMGMRDR